MINFQDLRDRYMAWSERMVTWWNDQPRSTKLLLLAWVAFQWVVLIVAVWIGPVRMFEILAEWADGLREMEYGWLLLLVTIIVTSVPPLLGYGTAQTLCGFTFGVINGWLLGTVGCLAGGCVAFLLTRRFIEYYVPMLKSNAHFKALSQAVRHKGLPLIILIRLCPFPFPYSNAFFASIESVSVFQFFIATLTITPKLLLHAWIGQRMYLFADPSSRAKLDSRAKTVNAVFIAVGTVLGAVVSWYLYKLTLKYVEEANALEPDAAYEDLEEGRGALMDDVDELLGDEDDDDQDEQGSEGARRTAKSAVSPLRGHSTESERSAGPRKSEDWNGSISDFGDDANRRRSIATLNGDDGDDAWGLEMDPVEEERSSEDEYKDRDSEPEDWRRLPEPKLRRD